jgi:PAS domain S-box-containing protein
MRPFFLLEPGDGLLLCSADGTVGHVDRIARERLGFRAQQWCGQTLQVCWPQLAALIIQEHRRLSEGPRDHVVPLPEPTGVELATRVRLFLTDSGFGVGVLRRRPQSLEAGLLGSGEDTYRRLLEAVLDTAQDAVLVTLAEPLDAPGPVIVFANQSLLDQSGYALHQVLGRSPRLFQGPDTSREATQALRAALDRWQPATMRVLNYCADRSTCWIELKVAPLADSSGWYSHWVSVQRDVSERVEREQQLAREAQALAERLQSRQMVD